MAELLILKAVIEMNIRDGDFNKIGEVIGDQNCKLIFNEFHANRETDVPFCFSRFRYSRPICRPFALIIPTYVSLKII